MKEFNVKIEVSLKSAVLDPQGKTVLNALKNLGFNDVLDTRIGKLIEIKAKGESKKSVKNTVDEICNKLLVNPIIEDYNIKISEL